MLLYEAQVRQFGRRIRTGYCWDTDNLGTAACVP
jgi:hypothetical protein